MSNSFWMNMAFAAFGGIVGNITAGPMTNIQESLQQTYCGAELRFLAGGKLRDEAVAVERSLRRAGRYTIDARAVVVGLHRQANAEFEIAVACGHARAMVALGSGVCWGFGTPANWQKGISMLREAARKDAGVAAEFLSPGEIERVCPEFKG